MATGAVSPFGKPASIFPPPPSHPFLARSSPTHHAHTTPTPLPAIRHPIPCGDHHVPPPRPPNACAPRDQKTQRGLGERLVGWVVYPLSSTRFRMGAPAEDLAGGRGGCLGTNGTDVTDATDAVRVVGGMMDPHSGCSARRTRRLIRRGTAELCRACSISVVEMEERVLAVAEERGFLPLPRFRCSAAPLPLVILLHIHRETGAKGMTSPVDGAHVLYSIWEPAVRLRPTGIAVGRCLRPRCLGRDGRINLPLSNGAWATPVQKFCLPLSGLLFGGVKDPEML
ncbi:hypothetical protein VC83_02107 [Pseudogymnoascus destructans]|uniref:Uncharacterized protein n=1 Tax=Pseudogymnoascus destructans TaxID=655981 RepID=A0A177AK82_9PEZI|nr:uncharacterized protein VC83_02107 [Pseudogymnoascus destructans]OAF61701.1 hypothetical protein VC83_02107 [Pseudogymnoascus destructans]